MPGNDRPDRGLLWWILAVTILTVLGSVGVVVFGTPDRSTVSAGPRPPSQMSTPESMPEPVPTVPPGESALHAMLVPGRDACPNFRQRRHQVPGEELEGYLSSMLDCLMRVNEPAFTDEGLPLRRPELAPESELEDSGCINENRQPSDWAGLYCPANATIYYRSDWTPEEPVQYVDVMVHEYIHHLQNEAGILAPVSAEQKAAREQPNGEIRVQELSRRVELHAECLTGVMVGPEGPMSVRSGDLDDLVDFRSSVPPEWAATHGSGRAQTRWFERGAYADGPQRYAACNTFTAAATLVE